MMSLMIGIDLGTTHSCAATFMNNDVKLIPNDNNKVLIPSLVAFNDDQILVGENVLYQMATNPENSIYGIKRFMGRTFDDRSIQNYIKICPFRVSKTTNNQCKIDVKFNKKERSFSPEEISAQILKKLKTACEKHHQGRIIKNAVISVPAYFSNNQKAATRNAGLLAGLTVKCIIHEPTAAALAYGFGRNQYDSATRYILVYDLGGGTFDISILKICGREFVVLAINGDNHLGGDDFTNRMVTHLLREFEETHDISVTVSPEMRMKLKEVCEKVKIKLSYCPSSDIELNNFYTTEGMEGIDFSTSISRSTFEYVNQDLFATTMKLVDDCVENANLSSSRIDEVILVGGSTKIPKIRQMLCEKFTTSKVNTSVNPDEAVALGAAIESAILSSCSSDVLKDIKLVDITPLSLGMQVSLDRKMLKFISKFTTIPTRSTRSCVTVHDNQSSAAFPIYEGESDYTKDNVYIGKFQIFNIPRKPAGSVVFDVTFDLDKNGILCVTAVEQETKLTGTITISNDFGRLSTIQMIHLTFRSNELVNATAVDRTRADTKRLLERYTYDITDFLEREEVQEKITSRVEKTSRSKNETAKRFLIKSENASEAEIHQVLLDLKSFCDPKLNDLFYQYERRNIGEN